MATKRKRIDPEEIGRLGGRGRVGRLVMLERLRQLHGREATCPGSFRPYGVQVAGPADVLLVKLLAEQDRIAELARLT